MNSEVKSAIQSKTMWGAIIALASTGAKIAGYDIGNPELYVNDIVSLVGVVFAMYGRITATTRVKII